MLCLHLHYRQGKHFTWCPSLNWESPTCWLVHCLEATTKKSFIIYFTGRSMNMRSCWEIGKWVCVMSVWLSLFSTYSHHSNLEYTSVIVANNTTIVSILESLRLPFVVQTSNRYVIIQHMIYPRFMLPLLFVAHVCTCRPVSRRLNFPQWFSRDSRLIYTFGKFILVKLVTSHCDLPFAICTINGNHKLPIT